MDQKPHIERGFFDFQESFFVGRRGIPIFWVFLLVVGVLWLLQDLGIITAKIPWWPVIIILIAVWMISKRLIR